MMKRALLIFGLLLICIPISYYYTLESNQKKLPIVNPSELVDDVVDPELRNKSMGHTIQEFRFLNQNNRYVDSRELEGKIWIVEYFFCHLSEYLSNHEC